MPDEIKAGDLVRVAYPLPCCGAMVASGYTYYVGKVETIRKATYCKFCDSHYPSITIVYEMGGGCAHLIDVLKRIDPPSLQDEVTEDTEVTA